MARTYEYDTVTSKDRGELGRLIEEREGQGWELFTITESWAKWIDAPEPNETPHRFTAWMRRPRRGEHSGRMTAV